MGSCRHDCRHGELKLALRRRRTTTIRLRRTADRRLRVAGGEVLQEHHVLGGALVLDYDAVFGSVGGDEELVLSHLAEANQGGGFGAVPAELAEALDQDRAVGGSVVDGD